MNKNKLKKNAIYITINFILVVFFGGGLKLSGMIVFNDYERGTIKTFSVAKSSKRVCTGDSFKAF